ncbi:hypothetical protein SAMN05443545_11240 [Aidingimonas halophila]|uniref:Uncharacterized protein n=1 Tax=Aidingimonas halophila TaxID=574349 RepID=A0A1H3HK81_9GAMM|nr:hypothetical protein SAMN05443545_11240 [Aidingimonas halophila]
MSEDPALQAFCAFFQKLDKFYTNCASVKAASGSGLLAPARRFWPSLVRH